MNIQILIPELDCCCIIWKISWCLDGFLAATLFVSIHVPFACSNKHSASMNHKHLYGFLCSGMARWVDPLNSAEINRKTARKQWKAFGKLPHGKHRIVIFSNFQSILWFYQRFSQSASPITSRYFCMHILKIFHVRNSKFFSAWGLLARTTENLLSRATNLWLCHCFDILCFKCMCV